MDFKKPVEVALISEDEENNDKRVGEETTAQVLPPPPVLPIVNNSPHPPQFYRDLLASILQKRLDPQTLSMCGEFNKLPLYDQLTNFCNAVSQSSQGETNRHYFIYDLTAFLRQIYPNCHLYPFGSSSTTLAEDDSDLDLFVYIPSKNDSTFSSVSMESKTKNQIKPILDAVTRLLRRNTDFAENIIAIRGANVPIVRFIHIPSQIQCDLSFSSFVAVRNTQFISFCMALHPIVPLLLRIVRYWAKFHEFTGSFKIKSYCLNLLVIFYCGWEGIIPSLGQMRSIPGIVSEDAGLDHIDGWETFVPSLHNQDNIDLIHSAFMTSISVPTDIDQHGAAIVPTLLRLLSGFFSFYANLDFDTNIICTNTFEIINKQEFASATYSAVAARKYNTWVTTRKSKTDKFLNVNLPVCIQDPFVLNVNLGAVTSQQLLENFQQCCLETSQIIDGGQVLQFQSILVLFRPPNPSKPLPQPIPNQVSRSTALGTMQEVVSVMSNTTPNQSKDVSNGLESEKELVNLGLRLKPVNTFVQQFARSAIQVFPCSGSGKYDSWSLTQKLKRLWISFTNEFVNEFVKDCLKMEVVTRNGKSSNIPQAEPDSSSQTEPRPLKYPQKAFPQAEQDLKSKKVCPQNMIDVPHNQKNTLKRKIDLLPETKKKTTCTIIHVKGSPSILFSSKERNRLKDMIGEKDKPPPTKKSRKPTHDPLEMEKKVTQIIHDNAAGQADGGTVELTLYIKLDCQVEDAMPTLDLTFQGVNIPNYENEEHPVKTLAAIVFNTFRDYTLYRLKKWIECGLDLTK